MEKDRQLRGDLDELLAGGGAHMSYDQAVTGVPPELRGAKPESLPYTPWRLIEHMRIAQRDILDYSRAAEDYETPAWPEGFWPSGPAPESDEAWDRSVAQFQADLQAVRDLVADPATDLLAPIPGGSGHTVLREAMLVADHNSHHLGQLVTVRRLLGALETDNQAPDNL